MVIVIADAEAGRNENKKQLTDLYEFDHDSF